MEARKFTVRLENRYWNQDSPTLVQRLRIGIERSAPRAYLNANDFIVSNICSLREDVLDCLYIGAL